MKLLFLAESKKFLYSWFHVLILSITIIMPFLVLNISVFTQQGAQAMDNTSLEGTQIQYHQDQIRQDIAGIVDEEWLTEREVQLAKMDELHINPNDLSYQTIEKAYWDGRIAFELKQGILKDDNTPIHVKQTYESHVLQYGPYEDWLLYFESLSISNIVYAIACIALFSDIFNKEDESGTVELIRSSKFGRFPITTSKIGLALLISITLGVGVYAMNHVASTLSLQLSGGNTTALMMRKPQFMSFQDIQQVSFWFTILGGMITTTFALCTSSCIKKMSVALSLGILFILMPNLSNFNILQTSWAQFFPSVFLNITRSSLQSPWLQLGGYIDVALVLLQKVWIPIMIMMLWIIYHSQSMHKRPRNIYVRK